MYKTTHSKGPTAHIFSIFYTLWSISSHPPTDLFTYEYCHRQNQLSVNLQALIFKNNVQLKIMYLYVHVHNSFFQGEMFCSSGNIRLGRHWFTVSHITEITHSFPTYFPLTQKYLPCTHQHFFSIKPY